MVAVVQMLVSANVHARMSVLLITQLCHQILLPLWMTLRFLNYCELFSDVHCPIALKLNVNSPLEEKAQLDDVRNCTNINNIKHTNTNGTNPAQGKPKWRKDKESDFVDALD
eukprot:TRINITY_DN14980_c0_g1_i8.p1 TRINITY_DN14980_c0_g1~~TRINITY_DN14980_c0_g1_i8.p1  ORF type:complete len:112 (-),score=9.19 TRINITY_DN14980_c0_g1_i8:146-481(-)